jgi:thymidylate kinase
MKRKFRYIAVEGNEGTGKTVLSKALAERIGAVWTYEPNEETAELKAIEKLALKTKGITNTSREFLLLANRSNHHDKIVNPLIESGKTLVTDRSFFSGMVYANIQTYKPNDWSELYKLVQLKYMPEVIIFCRSSQQKIEKEEGDIYDNADQSFLSKIDASYNECLKYIDNHPPFNQVWVVEFFNDFSKPISENLEILVKQLEGIFHVPQARKKPE